mgnify:CR=1 FL=1
MPVCYLQDHHGLSRPRFLGFTKNLTFFGTAAIAHNIPKAAKFLQLFGVPDLIADRIIVPRNPKAGAKTA